MELNLKNYFKGKTVLITGGTGSIGEYLVRKLLKFPFKKIIVFSRDEWKQYRLNNELSEFLGKLEFRIGDIRDFDSVLSATKGVDLIYHAAAMKHVPICERNPMEAVYTNTYGAFNLKEAAIRNKVDRVIVISTDKAVRSVNVMGMTKALQERIFLSDNRNIATKFICVRFGNVVGSRGSVVPLFKDRIKKGKSILLTDKRMTRFLITLENAMDLIFTATIEGKGREIFVKKMPVCQICDLAKVMVENIKHVSIDNYPVQIVGLREGEQLYETLVSEEEMNRAEESNDYFVIYPHGTPNLPRIKTSIGEYRTDLFKNRMKENEIKEVLSVDGWI